jgi:hypothetical protein
MPEGAERLEGITNKEGHYEVIMKIASFYSIYSSIASILALYDTFGLAIHNTPTIQ